MFRLATVSEYVNLWKQSWRRARERCRDVTQIAAAGAPTSADGRGELCEALSGLYEYGVVMVVMMTTVMTGER